MTPKQRVNWRRWWAKKSPAFKAAAMLRLRKLREKYKRINYRTFARLKRAGCADCGGVFPPCAMDFDHVRGTKWRGVGEIVCRNPVKVLEEIAKCDVVCANCHRVRTMKRRRRGRS